jgi:hypothetical protein
MTGEEVSTSNTESIEVKTPPELEPLPVRVEKGATLLDAKEPGWAPRIDLDRLDLSRACDCIIGQTYGNPPGEYETSLRKLGIGGMDKDTRRSRDILYGFELAPIERHLNMKNEHRALWEAEVKKRR